MGKKKSDDDDGGGGGDRVTSLFAADNPFRRQPQLPIAAPQDEDAKEKKVGKHPKPIADDADLQLRQKQKKKHRTTDEGEANKEEKKRKKRKRDEIEEEYEKRRFVSNEEENGTEKAVAVVGQKRKAEELAPPDAKEEVSFDDEAKLLRTIFVGNLPLKTKKKSLIKEFASFGSIDSARIRSIPVADTTAPRKAAIFSGKLNDAIDSVHAYIVFKEEQSARAALAHNMVKFGGNHIRVDMACPPRKKIKGEAPVYSVKKTVFVGNLPFDVKDEEIYQLFCEEHRMESSLEAVRVIRDPQTSLGKGIAYVMFKTREAANSIVKKKGIKLRDRELRLSHARSDASTPSKRKIENRGASEYAPSKRRFENYGASEYPYTRSPDSWKADRKFKVTASSLSYQGIRSSKSGTPKKAPKINRHGSSDSGMHKRSGGKVRTQKRPAVAARKAKANAQNQAQKKRKLDGAMSDNMRRGKKARHFS